jgi:hypothetical protein
VDRVATHTHWGWTSGYAYNQATMEERWGTLTAVHSTNHSEAACEWRSNYISRRNLSYLLSISSHSYALTHTLTHTCMQCYRVIQASVVTILNGGKWSCINGHPCLPSLSKSESLLTYKED